MMSSPRASGVPTTRTRRALEYPTTLPLCPNNALCKHPAFEHVQNDRRRMAFYAIAQHTLSPHTTLLATARRTPRRSALLVRCGNDVRSPLWCDVVFSAWWHNWEWPPSFLVHSIQGGLWKHALRKWSVWCNTHKSYADIISNFIFYEIFIKKHNKRDISKKL